MFCPECGTDIESMANFCRHCGHRLFPLVSPSTIRVTGELASEPLSLQPPVAIPRPHRTTAVLGLVDSGRVLSGRYELVSELGRGGMGQVWKALDKTLNLTVAVKVLPAEIASNPRAKNAMKQEAQLLMRLSHPNICRLYNYEEDGRVCY